METVRKSLYAALRRWRADYEKQVVAAVMAGELTPEQAETQLQQRDHAYRVIVPQIVRATGGNKKRGE